MINATSVLSLLIITLSLCSIAVSLTYSIVRTSDGSVRGKVLHTLWHKMEYAAFMGIPYAEPPVEHLRFKPPVPVKPWRQLIDAFKEGSVCPQIDSKTSNVSGEEDCLYLNVFTPEVIRRPWVPLKSVMVWIHGGGYASGYSNASYYGPDFFMEEDVLVVTFNYRLGVLGFLALNHPNITGNAGLKDQNLVLRWVQRNIAFFGGDPKKVTLFGESAGSSAIGFHILSEKSKGLFARSISMSGTPLCPWAYHNPGKMIENAYQLAAALHFIPKSKNDLVNYFSNVSMDRLVKAGQHVELNFLPFRPTLEDPSIDPTNSSFITECPFTKYNNGDFDHHPMILGYTHDEALFFVGPPISLANWISWPKKYLQDIRKYQQNFMFAPGFELLKLTSLLTVASFNELIKIANEIFFFAPIDLTQRLLAKHNNGHSIYYYRLSYQTEYAIHKMDGNPLNGTAHSDDEGYIFNVRSLHAPADPKNKFNQFRKRMVTMWANFAKYGDPTPRYIDDAVRNITWLPSEVDGFQLDINETSILHNRLIDKHVVDYEKSLYMALPALSACRHVPLNDTDIF